VDAAAVSAPAASASTGADDAAKPAAEQCEGDPCADIDALFAGKRKKSPAKPAKTTMPAADEPIMAWGAPSRTGIQRYTKDGLRILTEDDIKAENTQELNGECPFDCSCCF
jgi:Eukaryotic protein of unknown function (DUF1764)